MILGMIFQMICQMVDPFGKDRNLNLRRTGIILMIPVRVNNVVLPFLSYHDSSLDSTMLKKKTGEARILYSVLRYNSKGFFTTTLVAFELIYQFIHRAKGDFIPYSSQKIYAQGFAVEILGAVK